MTSKFTAVAKKRVKTIETPPSTIANIMKLFTVIDKDADGRIMSHDMGKHPCCKVDEMLNDEKKLRLLVRQ